MGLLRRPLWPWLVARWTPERRLKTARNIKPSVVARAGRRRSENAARASLDADMLSTLDEMNAFIEAGNTQPGGFYNERTMPPPTPPTPRHPHQQMLMMGAETQKLFSSFVESSVARREASNPSDRLRPPLQQQQPPRVPTPAPQQWRVTDEMMNMKWGTVLRTLQPAAANSSAAMAPHVTVRQQAPAFLMGKSYDVGGNPASHNQYLTPRPRMQQPGSLSARPFQ